MKVRIAEVNNDSVIKLKLEQNDDEVIVGSDWNLITFRIKEGKLVFVRNTGVEDDAISTDGDGAIVEVEE